LHITAKYSVIVFPAD